MNTVNTQHALIISHESSEYVMAGIHFAAAELNLGTNTRTPFGGTLESEDSVGTTFSIVPLVQKN